MVFVQSIDDLTDRENEDGNIKKLHEVFQLF